jgi:hypothetical protein
MYKDNSLIPTEAVRLAALGLLTEGPRSYGDLADEVRLFTSRIVGPSLDLIGPGRAAAWLVSQPAGTPLECHDRFLRHRRLPLRRRPLPGDGAGG